MALSLSAGCLQLEEGQQEGQAGTDEAAPGDAPTPVSSVDLEEAWSFEDLLDAVFASDGSFWGIADSQLLQVATDGTIEWESERVSGDVPLSTFGADDFDRRNVAVADERIAVGARDQDRTVVSVYTFDANTGSLQWSDDLDASTEQMQLEQIAYGDGMFVSILHVGSGSDQLSRLRAVESSTGDFQWEEQLDEATANYVTTLDGQVVVSTDDGIVAYDPQTGEQTATAIDIASRRPHASSRPETLCIATFEGVARVDLGEREPIWSTEQSRHVDTLAVDDRSVYGVDTAGYVYAYDIETGDVRWDTRLEIEHVRNGGFASSGDILWVSGNDGSLSGLATANGDPVYQDDLDEFGFPLAALDDRLVTSARETVAYSIETSDD